MKATKKEKRALIIFFASMAGFLILYMAGGFIASNAVCSTLFNHRGSTEKSLDTSIYYKLFKSQRDYPVLQERETLTFTSSNNETLTGYFYKNDAPKGTVIALHGIQSLADGDNAEYQQWFVKRGYNVFAVDLTASGRSEGDSMRGLHQSAFDAYSAYDYLLKNDRIVSPLIMVGHSWGAFGATASLSFGVKADYVIGFSGYDTPFNLMFESARERVGTFAEFSYPAFATATIITFGNNAKLSAKSAIQNSTAKALLIHGEVDMTVDYVNSTLFRAKDLPNVTTLSLPDCGHDRPWLTLEAKKYAKEAENKLDRSMTPEQVQQKLDEMGYDKEKSTVLEPKVFSAITDFLK